MKWTTEHWASADAANKRFRKQWRDQLARTIRKIRNARRAESPQIPVRLRNSGISQALLAIKFAYKQAGG